VPCPRGTFGAVPHLRNASECTPCSPGRFCDLPGLTAPTGNCFPGYYCPSGAKTGAPGEWACRKGGYCPEGSDFPLACPPGTFNDLEYSESSAACVMCTPGFFCEGERNDVPDGKCYGGFFCPGGDASPAPTNQTCRVGNFCPPGSVAEQPCLPGTFAASPGRSTCVSCTEHFACPGHGIVEPEPCSPGHYCPNGTASPIPCPPGTYSVRVDLGSEKEWSVPQSLEPPARSLRTKAVTYLHEAPALNAERVSDLLHPTVSSPRLAASDTTACSFRSVLCPPGYFCSTAGLEAPTAACAAGFYCEAGAQSTSAAVDADSPAGRRRAGPCPAGAYCIEGAEQPAACPPGTRCQEGAALPEPCPTGTYQLRSGAISCEACPQGFHCTPGGVVDFSNGSFYAAPGLHACADPAGGALMWSTETRGPEEAHITGVVRDAHDNAISCGFYNRGAGMGPSYHPGHDESSEHQSQGFIAKHDRDGNELWTVLLPQPGWADSVALDAVGNAYVAYRHEGEAVLIKLSACGTEAWTTTLASSGLPGWPDSKMSVSSTQDTIYVLVASRVVRVATNGTIEWNTDLELGASDRARAVAAAPLEGVVVAGETYEDLHGSSHVGSSGVADAFLLRLDAGGVLAWTRVFGSPGVDQVTAVAVDQDGDAFAVGSFGGTQVTAVLSAGGSSAASVGGLDAFVVKYSALGDALWARAIGTSSDDTGADIATDEMGNSYIAGRTNASLDGECFSGHDDLFLVKLSPAGDKHWTRLIKTHVFADGISVAARGDGVSVAGTLYGETVDETVNSGFGGVVRAQFASTATCVGVSQGMDFICPTGHFCPRGLENLEDGRCPRGTYSNYTGLANVSQCQECPPGFFCGDLGLSQPSGPCHSGYFCGGGAANAFGSLCDSRKVACDSPDCVSLEPRQPAASCGGSCSLSYFCPEGSREPIICPPGSFCSIDQADSPGGLCNAGYFCSTAGGKDPMPDGSVSGHGPCPPGFFCPEGTIYPEACPEGTYASQ
jgi:hypothetical protein